MEFLQQASRGLNDWWRYLLGIIIVCAGYMFGQAPLLLVIYYVQEKNGIDLSAINKFMETNDFSLLGISSNFGFFLMLCIFIFAFLFLLIALNLHKKKLIDITTTRESFDRLRFIWGAIIWFGLGVAVELVAYCIDPSNYYTTFKFESLVILIFIGLVILPIQTSTEEWFFRGYVMQGLYHFSKNPFIAIVFSSILFSSVHSMNPEIDKFGFWTMQVYYIGAGLFLGLLAYIDKGMELPLGVHFATNFYGACCVTYDGAVLQTDTLFRMKSTSATAMCIAFFIGAAIFLVLAFKRYQWKW